MPHPAVQRVNTRAGHLVYPGVEINGLPAHALLVHLVVVLLPLTALAAVAVSVWPAAQRKLTFLVPSSTTTTSR